MVVLVRLRTSPNLYLRPRRSGWAFVPNGALYRFIITSIKRHLHLWLIILTPESAPAWLWEEIPAKDINGPPSVRSTLRIVGRVGEKEGLLQSGVRGPRELWVQPTAQHGQSLHTCVRDEPLAERNTHADQMSTNTDSCVS